MGWSIPELPQLQQIKRPSYLLWAITGVVMMALGLVLTLFLYHNNDAAQFWLFAIGLPFTLWLLMLTCRSVYYAFLKSTNDEISQHQQAITRQWQNWSQVQLPIFGHYIICAEPDGLKALTTDNVNIPLYPQKARPLFNASTSTKPYWFLDEVMMNLAQQCADYRRYLTHIYLPNELIEDEDLSDAIFQRWDLRPQPVKDYGVLMTQMYENPAEVELSLLLVCQYDDDTYHYHSKFISALLLGKEALINKTSMLAKAWLGRLMVTDEAELSTDIGQLFRYNQLPPKKVKDIWISGLNDKTRLALTMASDELNVGGQHGVTFHDIDLTFAKPSKLTHYFVLTMASSRVGQSFREQLTMSRNQGAIYVQLISPKKFESEQDR